MLDHFLIIFFSASVKPMKEHSFTCIARLYNGQLNDKFIIKVVKLEDYNKKITLRLHQTFGETAKTNFALSTFCKERQRIK